MNTTVFLILTNPTITKITRQQCVSEIKDQCLSRWITKMDLWFQVHSLISRKPNQLASKQNITHLVLLVIRWFWFINGSSKCQLSKNKKSVYMDHIQIGFFCLILFYSDTTRCFSLTIRSIIGYINMDRILMYALHFTFGSTSFIDE